MERIRKSAIYNWEMYLNTGWIAPRKSILLTGGVMVSRDALLLYARRIHGSPVPDRESGRLGTCSDAGATFLAFLPDVSDGGGSRTATVRYWQLLAH